MRKVLKFLLIFILLIGFTACGNSKKSSDKVKVYVFEAGGCPYCAAQIDYLNSLKEKDTKFEIIEKELYIDHIEWQPGKDYDLGVKVANAFINAGYTEASYQGTPFVVISDIYATAAYSTDLLDIINQAYEEGDKDIVGCFEKGNNCDIPEYLSETDKRINDLKKDNKVHFIIAYTLIGAIILYLFVTRKKPTPKRVVKEPIKKPVKKTVKQTVKKTVKKPVNKKKN